jgi:hypothetical protein
MKTPFTSVQGRKKPRRVYVGQMHKLDDHEILEIISAYKAGRLVPVTRSKGAPQLGRNPKKSNKLTTSKVSGGYPITFLIRQ